MSGGGGVANIEITINQKNTVKETSSNYTPTVDDYFINCTANSFTVTLPTAIGATGQRYQIKNSGTGVVTLETTDSQTIDGNLSEYIYKGECITVISNNSNWYVL